MSEPLLDALAESYAEADNVVADMEEEPADGRRVHGVRLDPSTTTPDDWAAIIEEYRRLAAPPLHDPVGEPDHE